MPFGPIERGARDIDGHLICVRGEKIGACLLGHGFKLRNRGGPVDIDRYRQDLLFLTASIKARTTGSATSASSNARRTSRSICCIFDSVRRASPRSVLTMRVMRWVRVSNILFIL